MVTKLMVTHFKASNFGLASLISGNKDVCKFGYFSRNSASRHKLRFKLLGAQGDRWKLNDIDTNAMQERINSWLSKTQHFLTEVTLPLVKNGHSGKPDPGNEIDTQAMEDIFLAEQTIPSSTPNGNLSLAAIVSIEQFSRMNGLTGQKMQTIFKALVSKHVYDDACNLVEYCCFRFLSRDASDLHPCLKEPAFQKLIFITMLAWENPYCNEDDFNAHASRKAFFQGKLVGEEAFSRIAPAISGVADRPTVHNLFKALASNEQGISLGVWLTYIDELLKVHEGRRSYQVRECPQLSEERILCIGSSRKRPVLKWENNMAWPGKLTLTDKALYFEAVQFQGQKDAVRLALTGHGLEVKKVKVGPFKSGLFDSGVAVSSGPGSQTWVLEFVDLGGELRRDVWHAFISEIITLHKFLSEYGPDDDDQSLFQVFGSHKGREKAIMGACNGIARLQALQFMRKLLDDPIKLVQFSYLQNAPYGDVVFQALALNYWGGPLVAKFTDAGYQRAQAVSPSEEVYEVNDHVFDIDGSVYLRKWMRSPSWSSSASIAFWKHSPIRQAVVLNKNLVVADETLVERAAAICKQKYQAVEKTQATIDAATLQGIPSNIDLFKELVLPLTITARNFERLRRWEEPHLTLSFLGFAYTIIFRNLLSYMFPMVLLVLATSMLTLKGLKEQGRLGRSFGKVTIRDQPPSNTIQKIIAVKDAMRDVENYLQNLNVTLLKLRTILLAGQPQQITTEVALVLLSSATILLIVPFKYVLAFLLCDLFTRELEFRREMVRRFISFLKERWDTVPAAPVIVLPFEGEESRSVNQRSQSDKNAIRKKAEQSEA
ncbi:uncharacterized protein LOC110418460 isoform X1 [Herrania umbratica]|uniref:Uncharacterized protein LOC110418460 isoform X1 n=1 Tax=Herrania umbratica TaxID=108875 RepID=A0A6J1AJ43_9ROSI|nr:uncharacterized protein LOC110418460 isoform X1 [Herrania umbratica]XP_021286871.1 uncharacterized protein LOC110418460 isoform X1 [Herrania umbratica]XP_021286872.1 uncharacterized protein LOC110418460 isoform X1 [Herrania umbratica]